MAKDKIMPAIGCLPRRLYIENRLTGKTDLTNGIQDPCIMCQKRSDCVKTVVSF